MNVKHDENLWYNDGSYRTYYDRGIALSKEGFRRLNPRSQNIYRMVVIFYGYGFLTSYRNIQNSNITQIAVTFANRWQQDTHEIHGNSTPTKSKFQDYGQPHPRRINTWMVNSIWVWENVWIVLLLLQLWIRFSARSIPEVACLSFQQPGLRDVQ